MALAWSTIIQISPFLLSEQLQAMVMLPEGRGAFAGVEAIGVGIWMARRAERSFRVG
jgi:hypothetical protein